MRVWIAWFATSQIVSSGVVIERRRNPMPDKPLTPEEFAESVPEVTPRDCNCPEFMDGPQHYLEISKDCPWHGRFGPHRKEEECQS